MSDPASLSARNQAHLHNRLKERPALFSFRGKVRRLEFWLFYAGFMASLVILHSAASLVLVRVGGHGQAGIMAGLMVLIVMGLAIFCSFIVRRLRDAGRGWWPLPAILLSGPLLLTASAMDLGARMNVDHLVPKGDVGPSASAAGAAFMVSLFIFCFAAFICLRGIMAPSASLSGSRDPRNQTPHPGA